MTIRFACECGQQLSAKDEYAGKRVRCSGCGEIQTVPEANSAPETESASATIRLTCDQCGKVSQARAEHAGKKTKCPGCGALLTITAPTAKRSAAAISADRPKPSRASSHQDEEDEYEEEDRPRKSKKKKQSKGGFPWMWVGIGGGALVATVLVVWLVFFRKGDSPGGGSTERDVALDVEFVPRNAVGYTAVNLKQLVKSDLGQMTVGLIRMQDPESIKEFEEKSGLKLEDFAWVSAVAPDFSGQTSWAIVQTKKSYDRDRLLKSLEGPSENDKPGKPFSEKTHLGKKYYVKEQDAVYFADDNRFIIGTEAGIKQCLDPSKLAKNGPLDEAITLATSGKYEVVAAGFFATLDPQLKKLAAKQLAEAKSLLEAKSAIFTASVKDEIRLELNAEFPDAAKANSAKSEIDIQLGGVKGLLALSKLKVQGEQAQFIDKAIKVLDQVSPKVDGSKLAMSFSVNSKELQGGLQQVIAMAGGGPGAGGPRPGGGGPGAAAERAQAINNFKQVILGVINHADSNNGKMITSAAFTSPQRQPLLSWRVAILPLVDAKDLYDKINKNEAWNSPHNRQFHNQMPKCYQMPGKVKDRPGFTTIQLITGPGTLFPPNVQPRYPASIPDGTSNTILIAEGAVAVNWMEPRDIQFNQAAPRFGLGNRYGEGPLIALGNGEVLMLKRKVNDQTLKWLIDPRDGMVLPNDWK
jgi:hypothetical protein